MSATQMQSFSLSSLRPVKSGISDSIRQSIPVKYKPTNALAEALSQNLTPKLFLRSDISLVQMLPVECVTEGQLSTVGPVQDVVLVV